MCPGVCAVGLTGGRLVAGVSVSEVLRVLDDGDARHPDDHGVRAGLQRARADDAMVDVMEGAGRVLLATDHCNWTWGRDRQTDQLSACQSKTIIS